MHKGFHFILFNNSNGLGNTKAVTINRNQWLKNSLNEHPTYPKIIVCHIPLVPFREEKILYESFGFINYKLLGNNTLEIIQDHSGRIIAVLNGHLHLTGVVKTNNSLLPFVFPKDNDIYHISPSGLASYPCHYAHYRVFENRIDVKMMQIDSDLVTSSSSIHGKPYLKKNYIDINHRTPDSYVGGNLQERAFSNPISKSKRG